jgi:hypothetical protein
MADFLAIAGVSATLRNLLRDRMEDPVSVTIAPPDVTVSGVSGRRVNLYLFQVTENGSLKNQEIPGPGHPGDPLILDTSLLGELERVKVTLQPSTLDDTSKIWGALPEVSFRRSVSYLVSVVQIESRRPRRATLPVKEPRVYAVPMQTPRVDEIVRDPAFPGIRGAVAETGDTIVLRGRNLRGGGGTRVNVGTESVVPSAPRSDRISLAVPAALGAGTHAVQVVHDLMLDAAPGDPPVAHRGLQSNALPLLVIPRFVGAAPNPAAAGALVTVTVAPPVRATQETLLLLGDFAVPAEPVPHDAPPSATVEFRLPSGPAAIPAGTYLARVRVDGAESRLESDPVTTEYVSPTLAVVP